MKKFILCLAVAVAAAAITFAAMTYIPQWTQTRGFDTPEACALKLFDAIKAQDVQAMEACIAFDEMAEGFNYQGFVERIRALIDSYYLPGNDPAGLEYNRSHIRQLWYMRLKRFTYSIVAPDLADSLRSGHHVTGADESFAAMLESITAADSPNAFATLEYQGIITPDALPDIVENYYDERTQANLKREMAYWGIDTYKEMAIAVRCPEAEVYWGSTELLIPLRFVEIDGRWLADPTGTYIGTILGQYVNDLVFVQE